MDYAHASEIFSKASDATDPMLDWVEAQKRPYQKLMRGFEPRSFVFDGLEGSPFHQIIPNIPGPCEGTVFKFKSLSSPPYKNLDKSSRKEILDWQRETREEAKVFLKKFWQLGCPVIYDFGGHKCEVEMNSEKREVRDHYLFMPSDIENKSFGHETIGMPPQPRTLPNFEGQVTFLAYLMRKGYVTEADAPRGENPAAPFSAAMFGFAKTRAQELSL